MNLSFERIKAPDNTAALISTVAANLSVKHCSAGALNEANRFRRF